MTPAERRPGQSTPLGEPRRARHRLDPDHPWHRLEAEQVLSALDTTDEGLSEREAARRLTRHGPNRIERIRPVSWMRILASQFASLVVLLLASVALLAFALGDRLEAAAIAAVLAINTLIGFVVELRARRAMDALLRYEVSHAAVERGGERRIVTGDRLVPGDVVWLEEGDTVPADARVLGGSALAINEAPLTGESVPVDKSSDPVADPDAPLAERTSMLYSGTAVTRGRGHAVVVATGATTEMGRIGTLVAGVEDARTPLERRLDALGRRLVWLTLATAAMVTAVGVIRGAPLGLMLQTGIALAIAAVPEGLPAVATIALAVGLRRMARRHALVRRLAAVEALGATTVVCADKTGTLTAGHMSVVAAATADRSLPWAGSSSTDADAWLLELMRACALTSRARPAPAGERAVGDPTDVALTVFAREGGVRVEDLSEEFPEIEEVPFSTSTRSSASVRRSGGREVAFVKGAPEALLERATHWGTDTAPHPITQEARARFEAANQSLAADGLRVIALARHDRAEGAYVLLGLVGIVDPPAVGVPETISALRGAGIRTVMITGDQSATASAIARDLGLSASPERSLDGRALSALGPAELRARAGGVDVFSRVSPEHKLRIVDALQSEGDIVAMIGDGVNDAAALRKADIGVAMGLRGTDAAKQAASMVLGDDRFTTIAAAVEEGRVIDANIRKFVFYLFSCNVAEVLVLFLAGLAGMPVPLLPLQILWLNLVTDTFPALALALEPVEPGIMSRPPRPPDAAILSRGFLGAMGLFAVLITGVTLAAYGWGLATGDPARATTLAFVTLALAQLFHLGNARSRAPVLRPGRAVANPWALGAVPLVLVLQIAAVHADPLSRILDTVPLRPAEWGAALALALVPAAVGQARALLRRPAQPASATPSSRSEEISASP